MGETLLGRNSLWAKPADTAVTVRATTTVTVRAFRWCSARGTHVVNGDCVPFGTLGE